MLYAFIVATVLITLAELGDKTQLLALVLATRYRPWQVLVGIFWATVLVHLLSVILGQVVGALLPTTYLTWGAGVLFVGFGLWTLRGDTVDEGEARTQGRFGPILTTAIAFFLAELGDKTQIMTMTIAADPGAALRTFGGVASAWMPAGLSAPTGLPAFLGVWAGSTVGMMLADGVAILAGAVLGKALPEKLITRIAGVVFIVFGIGMVVAMYRG